MLLKTRGIVFKTIKYSETSIIADIYTEKKGLRKYIISGVRTKKAKINASLFQLMTLTDMVVYERESNSLNRTKEVRAAYVYHSLPFEIKRSAIGLFMVEVARKTIIEAEENPSLFNFLFDTFVHLDQSPHNVANLHFIFLLQLSGFLGFEPVDKYSEHTPFFDLKEGIFTASPPVHPYYTDKGHSDLFSQLLQSDRDHCHLIKMTRAERKKLLQHLLDFFRLHIENFPTINAHTILEEVLEE